MAFSRSGSAEKRQSILVQSAPTRLILLTGAPAAGKKTATSLITQITGISNIVEMSDLLKASKPKCDLNSTAALAPDSDACREFRKAVAMPSALPNSPGITVDGFPRSKTQVLHCIPNTQMPLCIELICCSSLCSAHAPCVLARYD